MLSPAEFVRLHDGRILREHVGDFPVGQAAGAEVAEVVFGDLAEVGFVADIVFVGDGDDPGGAVAPEADAGVFGLKGLDGVFEGGLEGDVAQGVGGGFFDVESGFIFLGGKRLV